MTVAFDSADPFASVLGARRGVQESAVAAPYLPAPTGPLYVVPERVDAAIAARVAKAFKHRPPEWRDLNIEHHKTLRYIEMCADSICGRDDLTIEVYSRHNDHEHLRIAVIPTEYKNPVATDAASNALSRTGLVSPPVSIEFLRGAQQRDEKSEGLQAFINMMGRVAAIANVLVALREDTR